MTRLSFLKAYVFWNFRNNNKKQIDDKQTIALEVLGTKQITRSNFLTILDSTKGKNNTSFFTRDYKTSSMRTKPVNCFETQTSPILIYNIGLFCFSKFGFTKINFSSLSHPWIKWILFTTWVQAGCHWDLLAQVLGRHPHVLAAAAEGQLTQTQLQAKCS